MVGGRMRAKSQIEQQRMAYVGAAAAFVVARALRKLPTPHPHLPTHACSAQRSTDFYKQILPYMYDASIIDQARFVGLMVRTQ